MQGGTVELDPAKMATSETLAAARQVRLFKWRSARLSRARISENGRNIADVPGLVEADNRLRPGISINENDIHH